MTGRRVLVTGASGFTGRYVWQALQHAGFQPYALSSDLCDESALKKEVALLKPDAVLHLAGIAYVGHGNPADFYHVNLIGTLHLLQALEGAGSITGPVVLASSANIYGNAYQKSAIKESFTPHPVNDYAMSKLAMEEMASLWQKRLPVTIVRPFNYTGAGQSSAFVVPKIVKAFREHHTELNLGNLSVWRDFSDVRDVSRWYTEILKQNITGETINFCSGKTVLLTDVIGWCEELTKLTLSVRSDTSLQRANELVRLCGDRAHLEKLMGKASMPEFSFRETLQWMLFNHQ